MDIVTANLLTPEENLDLLGDTLMSCVIKRTDLGKELRDYLFGQVTPGVFRNENFLLMSIMYKFKEKALVPDEDFLRIYLGRNRALMRDNSEYVSLDKYREDGLDENALLPACMASTISKLKLLESNNVVLTKDDFVSKLEQYKLEYRTIALDQSLLRSRRVLNEGVKEGNKVLEGYSDASTLIKKSMTDISVLLDQNNGDGFIDSSKMAMLEGDGEALELLGDFGELWELEKAWDGGYYTGMFYNVMAPTKGGKSKFCARATHNLLMHGTNVSVWAYEGGYKAWWAQMRAIHYSYLYIEKGTDEGLSAVLPIDQVKILRNKLDPKEKSLEAASMLDLFTNPNYGNLAMIDRPFKTETFLDDVETSVQLNHSKAVVFDYLQLISSVDTRKPKSQAIGDAYQSLLSYCKKRNVMVMSPSQFKQADIKELAQSDSGVDLRTSGGESAEIVRTPDYNLVMYASIEDLSNHRMVLKSIPSRFAAPFLDIEMVVDLAACRFKCLKDDPGI